MIVKINKEKLNNPKSWLGRVWVTVSVLVFLFIALFFFSFFIALFCAVFVAALLYGLLLQSKLKRRKSDQVIEGNYTIIREEEHKSKLPRKLL